MGQETPQTQALTRALLEPSASRIQAFKDNPDALLQEHGVQLSDEEHQRLTEHLASHNVDELHEQLLGGGLHTMI